MLTVTAGALDRLSRKLSRKHAADAEAYRFTQKTGGWKLRLDQERPADTAFSHGGRSVLLLDAAVSVAMANLTLDVRTTDSGPRLRLRRGR
jgi:hypothetical protein